MMEPEQSTDSTTIDTKSWFSSMELPEVPEFLKPYLKPMEPNRTYIFSCVFFFVYLAIFVYLIQSETDELVFSNYLMFMGASMASLLTTLFIITTNPIFACLSTGSIIGNLLCELFVGTIYYPGQMDIYNGYVHHVVYILLLGISILYVDHVAIYNIASIAELPSALIAAKRIWKIDSWNYDAFNALMFFLLRVLMWVPVWGLSLFIDGASIGEKIAGTIVSLGGLYLHLNWVIKMVDKLWTKSYFSIKMTGIPDDSE
jgi:hypothetical protein